ncbi:MAG TPA: hypothetical protein VGM05_19810 [Planctomycetaceae bacterium]
MALQVQLLDPTGVQPATCYVKIVQANFNFADKSGLVTLYAYRDAASADAGKQPLQAFNLPITEQGTAAVIDPATGVTIQPAVPGFDALVTQLQTQYDALKAAFYTLVKALPQLASAQDV